MQPNSSESNSEQIPASGIFEATNKERNNVLSSSLKQSNKGTTNIEQYSRFTRRNSFIHSEFSSINYAPTPRISRKKTSKTNDETFLSSDNGSESESEDTLDVLSSKIIQIEQSDQQDDQCTISQEKTPVGGIDFHSINSPNQLNQEKSSHQLPPAKLVESNDGKFKFHSFKLASEILSDSAQRSIEFADSSDQSTTSHRDKIDDQIDLELNQDNITSTSLTPNKNPLSGSQISDEIEDSPHKRNRAEPTNVQYDKTLLLALNSTPELNVSNQSEEFVASLSSNPSSLSTTSNSLTKKSHNVEQEQVGYETPKLQLDASSTDKDSLNSTESLKRDSPTREYVSLNDLLDQIDMGNNSVANQENLTRPSSDQLIFSERIKTQLLKLHNVANTETTSISVNDTTENSLKKSHNQSEQLSNSPDATIHRSCITSENTTTTPPSTTIGDTTLNASNTSTVVSIDKIQPTPGLSLSFEKVNINLCASQTEKAETTQQDLVLRQLSTPTPAHSVDDHRNYVTPAPHIPKQAVERPSALSVLSTPTTLPSVGCEYTVGDIARLVREEYGKNTLITPAEYSSILSDACSVASFSRTKLDEELISRIIIGCEKELYRIQASKGITDLPNHPSSKYDSDPPVNFNRRPHPDDMPTKKRSKSPSVAAHLDRKNKKKQTVADTTTTNLTAEGTGNLQMGITREFDSPIKALSTLSQLYKECQRELTTLLPASDAFRLLTGHSAPAPTFLALSAAAEGHQKRVERWKARDPPYLQTSYTALQLVKGRPTTKRDWHFIAHHTWVCLVRFSMKLAPAPRSTPSNLIGLSLYVEDLDRILFQNRHDFTHPLTSLSVLAQICQAWILSTKQSVNTHTTTDFLVHMLAQLDTIVEWKSVSPMIAVTVAEDLRLNAELINALPRIDPTTLDGHLEAAVINTGNVIFDSLISYFLPLIDQAHTPRLLYFLADCTLQILIMTQRQLWSHYSYSTRQLRLQLLAAILPPPGGGMSVLELAGHADVASEVKHSINRYKTGVSLLESSSKQIKSRIAILINKMEQRIQVKHDSKYSELVTTLHGITHSLLVGIAKSLLEMCYNEIDLGSAVVKATHWNIVDSLTKFFIGAMDELADHLLCTLHGSLKKGQTLDFLRAEIKDMTMFLVFDLSGFTHQHYSTKCGLEEILHLSVGVAATHSLPNPQETAHNVWKRLVNSTIAALLLTPLNGYFQQKLFATIKEQYVTAANDAGLDTNVQMDRLVNYVKQRLEIALMCDSYLGMTPSIPFRFRPYPLTPKLVVDAYKAELTTKEVKLGSSLLFSDNSYSIRPHVYDSREHMYRHVLIDSFPPTLPTAVLHQEIRAILRRLNLSPVESELVLLSPNAGIVRAQTYLSYVVEIVEAAFLYEEPLSTSHRTILGTVHGERNSPSGHAIRYLTQAISAKSARILKHKWQTAGFVKGLSYCFHTAREQFRSLQEFLALLILPHAKVTTAAHPDVLVADQLNVAMLLEISPYTLKYNGQPQKYYEYSVRLVVHSKPTAEAAWLIDHMEFMGNASILRVHSWYFWATPTTTTDTLAITPPEVLNAPYRLTSISLRRCVNLHDAICILGHSLYADQVDAAYLTMESAEDIHPHKLNILWRDQHCSLEVDLRIALSDVRPMTMVLTLGGSDKLHARQLTLQQLIDSGAYTRLQKKQQADVAPLMKRKADTQITPATELTPHATSDLSNELTTSDSLAVTTLSDALAISQQDLLSTRIALQRLDTKLVGLSSVVDHLVTVLKISPSTISAIIRTSTAVTGQSSTVKALSESSACTK